MNRQAGTPQDKFHYHKVQHLPGEENAAVRTDFFWGGPRDRALADSIIKPKEGGFLGRPVFSGFPEGLLHLLGVYSQVGSRAGHSTPLAQPSLPNSSSLPLTSGSEMGLLNSKTHSRYVALSLEV